MTQTIDEAYVQFLDTMCRSTSFGILNEIYSDFAHKPLPRVHCIGDRAVPHEDFFKTLEYTTGILPSLRFLETARDKLEKLRHECKHDVVADSLELPKVKKSRLTGDRLVTWPSQQLETFQRSTDATRDWKQDLKDARVEIEEVKRLQAFFTLPLEDLEGTKPPSGSQISDTTAFLYKAHQRLSVAINMLLTYEEISANDAALKTWKDERNVKDLQNLSRAEMWTKHPRTMIYQAHKMLLDVLLMIHQERLEHELKPTSHGQARPVTALSNSVGLNSYRSGSGGGSHSNSSTKAKGFSRSPGGKPGNPNNSSSSSSNNSSGSSSNNNNNTNNNSSKGPQGQGNKGSNNSNNTANKSTGSPKPAASNASPAAKSSPQKSSPSTPAKP